jgi:hypothetical protein
VFSSCLLHVYYIVISCYYDLVNYLALPSNNVTIPVNRMPRCEGRPDGPCPLKKNDRSVHLSQGDLMLCAACEDFRFPAPTVNTNAKTTHTSTSSLSAERQPTDRHDDTQAGGGNVVENTANEPAGGAASNDTNKTINSNTCHTRIVIDELLTYHPPLPSPPLPFSPLPSPPFPPLLFLPHLSLLLWGSGGYNTGKKI